MIIVIADFRRSKKIKTYFHGTDNDKSNDSIISIVTNILHEGIEIYAAGLEF